MKEPSQKWQHVVLISGLLLIAVNLRPAITSLAPLAERMHADGVSVQMIGLQTTIPLLLFGAAGLFVGVIGGRVGFARALGFGLMMLALGCFVRSSTGTDVGRTIGSVLVGTGIAFGNVLLPGVVKSRYPRHVGVMTSLYSTSINMGGMLGIALAVPLAAHLPGGWSSSLSAWGYVVLLPLLLWVPQFLRKPTVRAPVRPFAGIIRLFRKPRAWQVTAQMGLQSLLFYSSVAWLPTVLQMRGMSEVNAYAWPAAMQLCGSVASLIIPTLAGRAKSQSLWAMSCASMSGLGIAGIIWLPFAWVGWSTIVLGFGLNAGFGMSLLLITLRSPNAETTGNLSSMAQACGYLVAAPFPWFVGWLNVVSGSWTVAYSALLIPVAGVMLAGFLAGRPGFVECEREG